MLAYHQEPIHETVATQHVGFRLRPRKQAFQTPDFVRVAAYAMYPGIPDLGFYYRKRMLEWKDGTGIRREIACLNRCSRIFFSQRFKDGVHLPDVRRSSVVGTVLDDQDILQFSNRLRGAVGGIVLNHHLLSRGSLPHKKRRYIGQRRPSVDPDVEKLHPGFCKVGNQGKGMTGDIRHFGCNCCMSEPGVQVL